MAIYKIAKFPDSVIARFIREKENGACFLLDKKKIKREKWRIPYLLETDKTCLKQTERIKIMFDNFLSIVDK